MANGAPTMCMYVNAQANNGNVCCFGTICVPIQMLLQNMPRLNTALAQEHQHDREAYTDAKGVFVDDVTARATAEKKTEPKPPQCRGSPYPLRREISAIKRQATGLTPMPMWVVLMATLRACGL